MDSQDKNTRCDGTELLTEPYLPPTGVDDKVLYRKIDAHIIPLMFASYFLQFLDKVLINYANIMGLQQDLGMHGQQFSWLATAFFIAYSIAEFPQGWLLQKFPPATVLGVNVLLWGILVGSTAACQNFAGLVAVRTLLGACEAVITPALILITSQWYTRRESTPRYGIWYCGLGGGQIAGGLVSFAAQHGPKMASLSGWRIMFIAVGIFNLVIAALILLLLPDTPDTASWLTKKEKTRVREKLALDQAGTGRKVFRKAALFEALSDIHVWILFLLTVLIVIPSGVVTSFSATLIAGFGYDSKSAALLNIPSGVVSIIATLGCTYAILIDFPRWLGIVLLMVPTLIGAGLLSFYKGTKGGVLAGIYLINFVVAPLALVYALAGVNTQGYTKKVTMNGVIAVGFGIANIIGPQTFLSWEAPEYISAKITIFAVNGAVIIVAIVLRLLYGWRNTPRIGERRTELHALRSGRIDIRALEKLEGEETDMRNKAFVYVY
ncbi:putative major facilitator superfamily general substrate [Rosellinia necatrix]|uniref:Putative major facilitator superfamily general substrate n=1 Tax=Rosellinia necatrix TaxID=77044 RepID=A0A1W2TBS4_ROSNE|nr:putative major facilitator superfamily general substrate [Rosellinia necatrix]